jgi:chaperone required for assembly of F1-ATPase
VSVVGGFCVRLDTRPIKTPETSTLLVPSETLADLIALEWSVQEIEIKPLTMPLMRLSCTAIDKVAPVRSGVIQQLAQYGISDLLCYRAERPDDLVMLQHERWQPILDWMEQTYKIPLNVTSGVIHIPQPDDTIDKLIALIDDYDDFTIAGLGEITQLTGSLVLGLATVERRIDGHFAFRASQIDDDWQTEQWGVDIEAVSRRNNLEADIKYATQFLGTLV